MNYVAKNNHFTKESIQKKERIAFPMKVTLANDSD